MNHTDIRIGTMTGSKGRETANYIKQILPLGFESFEINFWHDLGEVDLPLLAKEVLSVIEGKAVVGAIGIYGNPLQEEQTKHAFEKCIEAASLFNCNIVTGFAGALEGKPIPESMPKFREVWGDLARRAEDHNVRLALENCDMGGSWNAPLFNIAHSPAAWEMMFNEVPSPALGLEWEPCHQLYSLADPLPQLREWAKRIFVVHGKDATVAWDVVRKYGIRGGKPYVWHRTPGFGDTNWTDIISILRMEGFNGAIHIEGWHDPVYKGPLEMTGQVHAINYLKACRGGDFIPNPS